MDDSKTRQLHDLLKRLGKAVHGSVLNSDEVREVLHEMQDGGWNAVMLLEASVACKEDGLQRGPASMRIHVEPSAERVSYRIDATDADFLESIGISPSRHQSTSGRRRD